MFINFKKTYLWSPLISCKVKSFKSKELINNIMFNIKEEPKRLQLSRNNFLINLILKGF